MTKMEKFALSQMEIIDKQKREIELLHLTISRLTESHQEEMKKEIGYLQKRLDQLSEKIENYNLIINVHKQLGSANAEGGKNESR